MTIVMPRLAAADLAVFRGWLKFTAVDHARCLLYISNASRMVKHRPSLIAYIKESTSHHSLHNQQLPLHNQTTLLQ